MVVGYFYIAIVKLTEIELTVLNIHNVNRMKTSDICWIPTYRNAIVEERLVILTPECNHYLDSFIEDQTSTLHKKFHELADLVCFEFFSFKSGFKTVTCINR